MKKIMKRSTRKTNVAAKMLRNGVVKFTFTDKVGNAGNAKTASVPKRSRATQSYALSQRLTVAEWDTDALLDAVTELGDEYPILKAQHYTLFEATLTALENALDHIHSLANEVNR
jgi:hypothetical protein